MRGFIAAVHFAVPLWVELNRLFCFTFGTLLTSRGCAGRLCACRWDDSAGEWRFSCCLFFGQLTGSKLKQSFPKHRKRLRGERERERERAVGCSFGHASFARPPQLEHHVVVRASSARGGEQQTDVTTKHPYKYIHKSRKRNRTKADRPAAAEASPALSSLLTLCCPSLKKKTADQGTYSPF